MRVKDLFCVLPISTMYEICVQLELNRPSWMMSLSSVLTLAASEFRISGCDYSDFLNFKGVAEWRAKSNGEAFFYVEYNGKCCEITGDFFDVYYGDNVYTGNDAKKFFVIG